MNTRTLLVDSSFLLKRSFHGAKDTYTSNFGHIGGLYSFMTTLRKLIKQHMINKVLLVWDGENGGIHRYRIDSDYKSNRKDKEWFKKIELSTYEIKREEEKEESILKQRKRIQAYAEELFLRQIEIDELEADDIIAEYCYKYHKIEDIYIYTNDRDFSQLLELGITIIFANIAQPVTKNNYMMYFNHHYTNSLTIKIICGDTADVVKGIKGIKEKVLLKHIPELAFKTMTVRDICVRGDGINRERVKQKKKPLKIFENLLNNIERLKINYKLTNLSNPILNEEAVNEIDMQLTPLSPDDRGSKNLYIMMLEDGFLTIYTGTFPNYVEPFYTVIMNEKKILTEYLKKNKGLV